jgi:hypothetical protein
MGIRQSGGATWAGEARPEAGSSSNVPEQRAKRRPITAQQNLETTVAVAARRMQLTRSHRPPIKVLHRNGRQVQPFDAPQVDGRHAVALRVRAFAVSMDAAGGAEAVLDDARAAQA